MKKFILFQGLLFAATLVLAQEPEKMQPPKSQPAADVNTLTNESVEMKDGKLWLTSNGNVTLLSREITLGGSRVSTDGTIVLKDGRKVTLKNGDKVTSDGVLVKARDNSPYPPEQKMPDNK